MRRPGVRGLDAFHLDGFERLPVPLRLFLQLLDEFALPDDDGVELLHLMFEVGDVRLDAFEPLGSFVRHGLLVTGGGGRRKLNRGAGGIFLPLMPDVC